MEMDARYLDYRRDESRLEGDGKEIFFPETTEEVCELMARAKSEGLTLTIQGGRTNIYGGAVPQGGLVLNFSRMAGITGVTLLEDGAFGVTVKPGTLLSDLQDFCRSRKADTTGWPEESVQSLAKLAEAGRVFFPVEPSEPTATIGGIISTDARGSSFAQFGGVAKYLEAVELVLPNGACHHLSRGEYTAQGGKLALPGGAETPAADGTDLLDMVIGGEGLLGAVTSATLRLLPQPGDRWAAFFFFDEKEQGLEFTEKAKASGTVDTIYFDYSIFDLIGERKEQMESLKEIPDPPQGKKAAVYTELSAETEDDAQEILMELLEAFAECDGLDEDTWAVSGSEIEKLRLVYHAALELEGICLDNIRRDNPELKRACMDYQVPGEKYRAFLEECGKKCAGRQAVFFGCACRGHLHVGLLPDGAASAEDEALLRELSGLAEQMGGGIATDFGYGPLKAAMGLEPDALRSRIAESLA